MRLEPATIAGVARAAGFDGRPLQVATALALASSGGNTEHHRLAGMPGTGDWRGLWAIDVDRWPRSADHDLWTPSGAAGAAYTLTQEHGGFGWSPQYRAGTWVHQMGVAATAATYHEPGQVPTSPQPFGTWDRRIHALVDECAHQRARLATAPRRGR